MKKKHLSYDDLEAEEYEAYLRVRGPKNYMIMLWNKVCDNIQRSFWLCFIVALTLTVLLIYVVCRITFG